MRHSSKDRKMSYNQDIHSLAIQAAQTIYESEDRALEALIEKHDPMEKIIVIANEHSKDMAVVLNDLVTKTTERLNELDSIAEY